MGIENTYADKTAFADQKMSSQLTNLVSVFNGTNYQQWATAMQSFLMSQGQWKCIKDSADVPAEVKVEDSVTNTVSGPLYPSALNVFEDSSRSNQSHWSLLIG